MYSRKLQYFLVYIDDVLLFANVLEDAKLSLYWKLVCVQ